MVDKFEGGIDGAAYKKELLAISKEQLDYYVATSKRIEKLWSGGDGILAAHVTLALAQVAIEIVPHKNQKKKVAFIKVGDATLFRIERYYHDRNVHSQISKSYTIERTCLIDVISGCRFELADYHGKHY